jgi:HD-GYP domain-containing protein (c-di-GMP phosphodiesterase class II)
MAMFMAKHLGHGTSRLRRIGMVGKFVATAGRGVQKLMQTHCQSTSDLAGRLDLGESVAGPLVQAFERWDGKGVPGLVGKTDLAPAIRLVHLADNIEAFHHSGGVEAAVEVATSRRGTQFDPELVDRFCARPEFFLDGLGSFQAWDQVIDLDPRLGECLSPAKLDAALDALGDFADLKSPFFLGHARGVAELAAEAGTAMGMTPEDTTNLRRAAAIHDIGMVGVPSGVWDATEPWTLAQSERARTHPYLAERTLARVPAMKPIVACAAQHHERLDGSGYPHGLTAAAIGPTARVLAAADVYQALRQARPHRPALDGSAAVSTMQQEVQAGRLDPEAVNAVLRVAGHRVGRRAVLPSGLTRREADVLVELARGSSNSEIASVLTISRKTVSSHLEHIYTKIGVTTRTEAALFAMRTGLLDALAG